jgi:serine/threonine protein kinase
LHTAAAAGIGAAPLAFANIIVAPQNNHLTKIPDRIGKYEVIRRLGYGGMGTVFLARDPDLDRLLAIKVLRDLLFDEHLLQRFLREARAAGNLRHDNIITVYDAGEHDHQPFMAMEYVDGVSFAETIRSRQPLALADKLSYLEQVCAGLHYAHSRGIIHRDVKPANLMVDRRHTVRILDFGIARVEGSGITRDGSLIGTLNYMSPEQMLGRPVDHRSDIFGFGAVAYELIAYERAFPGSVDDGLLHRLPNESPRPLSEVCPGLPPDLEPVVMRALAKLPEDRFADLDEARLAIRQIRRQLDPHVDVEPISGSKPGIRSPLAPPSSSSPSTERQEFLERRSRQVAYHRDAARNALKANDLDAAAAACEDALTLDPDDREALQLLSEIDQAREQRGVETKERRERERLVRRHVANADLKLSKGDAAAAAELLRQALALDPQNEAALALLPRTAQPAGQGGANGVAPTVVRPQSRPRTGSGESRGEKIATGAGAAAAPPSSASASPLAVADLPEVAPAAAAARSSVTRYAAAAAFAAVALIAVIMWMRSDGAAPSPDPRIAAVEEPYAGVPDGVRPSDTPAPQTARSVDAAPDSGNTAGSPGGSAPVPAATTAAPTPRPQSSRPETPRAPPVVPTVIGASSPAPAATPAPAGARDPATAETGPGPTSVPIDLGPVERALSTGDVSGALSLLEALANQTDERVRSAARRTAERSMDDMAAAERAAGVLKAEELASSQFAAASGSKVRAERAFERDDYPQAVRQAIAATTGFRTAADEARRVAETRRRDAEALTAKLSAPKGPELDRAGILAALQRFQAAYQKRDVDAIRQVFPSYPQREFKRRFSDCRDLNVTFSGIEPAPVADDLNVALVVLRSSYYCQPRIKAPPQEVAQDDLFRLRKLGDGWYIERSGALDALQ